MHKKILKRKYVLKHKYIGIPYNEWGFCEINFYRQFHKHGIFDHAEHFFILICRLFTYYIISMHILFCACGLLHESLV